MPLASSLVTVGGAKGGKRWEMGETGSAAQLGRACTHTSVCVWAIPVTVLENFNKRESPKHAVYVCLSFWECPDKERDRKMYCFLRRCR
jgi:hypothetical protein